MDRRIHVQVRERHFLLSFLPYGRNEQIDGALDYHCYEYPADVRYIDTMRIRISMLVKRLFWEEAGQGVCFDTTLNMPMNTYNSSNLLCCFLLSLSLSLLVISIHSGALLLRRLMIGDDR